ncbi:calcium-binding protein, partial [Aestuariicoccus sp. MJ-SS9]|uniref:calcium-binding protein n=1 Tax=Aestuariicoccus sp. MJ-SS9 TaxID=3079855 RepID=UPI002912EAF8
DSLDGGDGRDRLFGGDGNDTLDASGGAAETQGFGDQVRPGLGADTILGHAGLWELGEGNNLSYGDISGVGGMTIAIGVDGTGTAVSGDAGLVDDTFTFVNFVEGSQDGDLITGADEDRFQGYAPLGGDDTVHGGAGFDQLQYDFEMDWFGGEGSGITVDWDAGTVIDTQGNTDTFTGIESIRGSQLGDLMDATGMTEWTQLRGEGGDDRLIGGVGDNRFRGGDGVDTAVIGVNYDDATISEDGGTTVVESSEGYDELEDIEFVEFLDGTLDLADNTFTSDGPADQTLIGTDDADDLTGNEGDDNIFGLGGDDTLDGAGGNDNIGAGPGDDLLRGSAGDDLMGGGTGNDDMDGDAGNDFMGGGQDDDTVDGGIGNDVVNGGPGNDLLIGGDGNDTMGGSFGSDTIQGNAGNDDLGGGSGQDSISAGAGDDSVGGGEANDVITGGGGNDFLAGGGRDDDIDGGLGNDTINGGDGDDTMTGGEGADVFVWNFFKDGDADVITDFEDGVDSFRMVGVENAPGSGLAGKVAALNITDTAGGALIDYQGHTVLIQGIAAADLTTEDFTFL